MSANGEQDQSDANPPQIPSYSVLSHPREDHLVRGGAFHGDLRNLPQTPPERLERLEFEEPSPRPSLLPGTPGVPTTAPAVVTPPQPAAPAPAPSATFDGLDFATWGAGHPPDTNGDVGPVYYIQTINTSIGIFNKSNGVRVAAFTFNTFFNGHFGNLCDTNNFGDPVVLYDSFEDRWIITDFAFVLSGGNPAAPVFQCFAISKSGDPVSGGWNFYSIQTAATSADAFGDYPKFGIWPDGLYMSANMFNLTGNAFRNPRVWAFNKAQMYAGLPTVQILSFDAPSADFTVLPSNARLQAGTPPPGTPNFFVSTWEFLNALTVYKFHVDWNNTSLSTFSGPDKPLAATSWPNATVANAPSQAGNSLDVLQIRAMVQNQYTNIGGHESLWTTHTVRRQNTTGFAASRWYQVDVTGGTVNLNIPQATTWDPDNANVLHRFVPSLAVDRAGDLALGYSTSSSTTKPAIKYAGRLAGDPVNTFSQGEQLLIQGTGTQTGTCGGTCTRWGDYSAMTLDPDGCTFWYTNEYYATDGLNFLTRIGSFSYPSCTPVGGGGAVSGTVTAAGTGNPISGATVTLGSRTAATAPDGTYSFPSLPAGTYPSITASFAGFVSSTATSIVVNDGLTTTQNFSLTGAAATTTLAVNPATGTFAGTVNLSATLTSNSTGVSGKTVSFTLNGSPVGSGPTDGSGIATLSNVSLTGINAGSYPAAIAANFAGDSAFAASNGTATLTVSKADQTISFGALAGKTFGDLDFTVSATASSSLAVSFGASGNCTVTGSTVHLTGAGSCTITASQAGNANFNAAADVPQSFTIAKASQTISFGALAGKTFGDPDFTVSATASSTLAVTFAASGNCTMTGSTVHITGGGSCTITASQAGDANFNPAADVPQTFAIAKASQTISFGALAGKTFGDPDFSVSATASSTLAVTFGASGNCTVTGSTVHITGAGSCTITASQAGDANFNPAADVPQTFAIAKASQTISFGGLAGKTFGDLDFTVSATASSSLAISFGASGNCTVTSSTVHLTGAGSCTITASQAGNANFDAAADVPQSFAIAKGAQTISFAALANKNFGDPDFTVSATASSTLAVTFGAAGNCTVTGSTVHLTGAGSCTITASQAGNANFNAAADVPQSFTIAKGSQSITFGPLPNKTLSDPDFSVTATASSGLIVGFSATGNCTVSASTVHITGLGSCTITATQAGDANFNAAADVPQSFTIDKNSQTINFGPLANKTFGDPDFGVSATASSGLAVSFAASGNCSATGSTIHITGAGSCTITASQAGNANFNAATDVPQSFAIAKSSQTITFAALPNKLVGDADFSVSATASSALAVSFSAGGSCTVSGSTVHLTGAGTCTVTASQAGNSNFNAAANVPQSFTVAAPDFGLALNLPSVTVKAGQSVTDHITVSPNPTTTSPLTFACSGLPALSTCNFAPTTVPAGSAQVDVVLTITTTANTASLAQPRIFYAAWLQFSGLGLIGIVAVATRKKNRRAAARFAVLAMILLLSMLLGCGGHPKTGGNNGTPLGTSTVTVTGTSGTITHSTSFTLTVN